MTIFKELDSKQNLTLVLEPDRSQAYNQAATSLAWDRTLAFLKHSSTW
jgi:hypothetical protein